MGANKPGDSLNLLFAGGVSAVGFDLGVAFSVIVDATVEVFDTDDRLLGSFTISPAELILFFGVISDAAPIGRVNVLLASNNPEMVDNIAFGNPAVPSLGFCKGHAVTIVGDGSNNRLIGTAGPDVIAGLGGNDFIDGRGGADILCGGPGNDTLIGGSGGDRIYGDNGVDKLVGGKGDDRLFGEGGKDALDGGPGKDACDGGAGADKTENCEK